MLKLVEIQIVVTTLIDHFLFFLQFSVMCWDIYWNIHVLIWASWVHPIYCDICFVLPSASDILRYILSCRTIAIYDLPINLRYIYKRVSPLLNVVILPLIRGENHVIRGTITVSHLLATFGIFFGNFWHLLASFGNLWQLLASFGTFWHPFRQL